MARLNEITYERIVVDEQEMFIPNEDDWKAILDDGALDGLPIAAPAIIRNVMLKDAHPHPELKVALGRVRHVWMPYLLLQYPGGWQRVHSVFITCPNCQWQGLTANIGLVDIYAGVDDWVACMERGQARFPVLPCPRCHGALPTGPIWIAPD